jgi:ABC-type multidrug transport system ATPase subunit
MIETTQLSKRFNREWIFRDLSHSFLPGNTYALTGPNGSGKSTLIQVLCGYTPPTSGEVSYRIGGVEIDSDKIFKHISIAAPYMDLIEEFTLREQIEFHFQLKTVRDKLTATELIELMYLEKSSHKPIGNFSSGMKQRVKLGLAFYSQCDIIFLDEPGTNLDKNAFEWYLKELSKVPQQTLIIVASNNTSEYPATAQIINIFDYKS